MTAQTVVNPFVETAYFVRAEKMLGYFAYDTVRIKVHKLPPMTWEPTNVFAAVIALSLTLALALSNTCGAV